MSKFLAPIHSWLFNKVKMHENLEKKLVSAFESKHGKDFQTIVDANIKKYGDRLASDNIEDIIDESNIHGWLQERIAIAETRQAGIIGDLFSAYDDDAVELITSVYREDAKANAEIAKEQMDMESAEDVYKSINNFVLDGMPCDTASNVVRSEPDVLEAIQNNCLHINYWRNAGVDVNLMYEMRAEWTKAFVSGVNPDFIYSVSCHDSDDGSRKFVYTIKKR